MIIFLHSCAAPVVNNWRTIKSNASAISRRCTGNAITNLTIEIKWTLLRLRASDLSCDQHGPIRSAREMTETELERKPDGGAKGRKWRTWFRPDQTRPVQVWPGLKLTGPMSVLMWHGTARLDRVAILCLLRAISPIKHFLICYHCIAPGEKLPAPCCTSAC